MGEKKLRKRAEEAELKEKGLRETAPEERVPEVSMPKESATEDFVQEELQIRLPCRTGAVAGVPRFLPEPGVLR